MDFPLITANVPSINTVMNGAQKAGRVVVKGALITAVATTALGALAVLGTASAVESLLKRDKSPRVGLFSESESMALGIVLYTSVIIDAIVEYKKPFFAGRG